MEFPIGILLSNAFGHYLIKCSDDHRAGIELTWPLSEATWPKPYGFKRAPVVLKAKALPLFGNTGMEILRVA